MLGLKNDQVNYGELIRVATEVKVVGELLIHYVCFNPLIMFFGILNMAFEEIIWLFQMSKLHLRYLMVLRLVNSTYSHFAYGSFE